jgi:hypothetical protein
MGHPTIDEDCILVIRVVSGELEGVQMHDVLIVSVALLMILAGLFFNNRSISDLKSEIKDVRAEVRDLRIETRQGFEKVNDRFNRVDDRLTDIYRIIGEHEGRLQAVERER